MFGGLILMLLMVLGFAVALLWLRDHTGPIGAAIINWGMMALMGVIGLTIVGSGLYSLVLHALDFPDYFMTIWKPMGPYVLIWGLVWGCWKWFGYPPGIEKQEIDPQSPELVEAVNKAKRTLPRFIEQVCQHIDGAYVKIPVTEEKGVEHAWAYVHHYADGIFNVSPLKGPSDEGNELANRRAREYAKKRRFAVVVTGKELLDPQTKAYAKRRDVPESAVEDWRIIHADGSIEGGFSYIGAFRYLERKGVKLNRTMRMEKCLFLDAEAACS